MPITKRESSREDQPMQRVIRQREAVEHMRHDNEVLRLELTREERESRKNSGSGTGGSEVSR